jgi:hypothetical protein
LTFSLDGDVSGSITPIEITPFGRSIKNVASKYSSIIVNDVGGKETVSAREGRIILQDTTILASSDMLTIDGLDSSYLKRSKNREGHLHSESYELWPVIFKSASLIKYKGLGINDWDYKANTYDGFGENSLYNKNFEKLLYINASLIRFNTTVDASDLGISAWLLPTKSMEYKLTTNASGITDLYSRILDLNYDPKHRIYPDSMRSIERYVGDYGINRSITYQSSYEQSGESDPWYDQYDTWLPCCQPDEPAEVPQNL